MDAYGRGVESSRSTWDLLGAAGVVAALLVTAAPASAADGPHDQAGSRSTVRRLVAPDGAGDSYSGDVSGKGRYITYSSDAANLVPGDTNGKRDVFVHDRWTGRTNRVSMASNGSQANGDSWQVRISGDGRYVTYSSDAANLVPGDTNNTTDVFVYDQRTRRTTPVTAASDGTLGNGKSGRGDISGEGRFISFQSSASNLVPGDTNGKWDAFVYDQQTRLTTRVSVTSDGTQAENGESWRAVVSGDGRYIVFDSHAKNLVPGDTNVADDVFVYDQQTHRTTRVSVASDGSESSSHSWLAVTSVDGRYITYMSVACNLVPGDTNNKRDVFVYDRQTGRTTRASVASDGTQANGDSEIHAISGDGRYITFYSYASNLAAGDTNDSSDVFVYDQQTRSTTLVSVADDGTQGQGASHDPAISGDGRYISYYSYASNLVPGDTNDKSDVFVYDQQTRSTTLVSVP